jgi:ribonuclease D
VEYSGAGRARQNARDSAPKSSRSITNGEEENIGFLLSFTRHADRLTEEKVREIAGSWHSSIQLTAPAGFLLSAEDLLVDAASRYLRDTSPQAREQRTRQQAVALLRHAVREAVANRLDHRAERLVKNNLLLLAPEASTSSTSAAATGGLTSQRGRYHLSRAAAVIGSARLNPPHAPAKTCGGRRQSYPFASSSCLPKPRTMSIGFKTLRRLFGS